MKKTQYTEENVTLEQAGEYESTGWYLSVADKSGGGGGNLIAIEQEEIQRIANVCVRMLIEQEKPPKGVRKAKAK